VLCWPPMPRRRTVKDDPFPAMSWREREAAWKERERHLVLERKAAWEQLAEERVRRVRAEAEARKLKAELARARKRLAELESALRSSDDGGDATAGGAGGSKMPPAWVKENVAKDKPKKTPGRRAGHVAALRPMPSHIDQTIDVPLVRDERGRELCPRCRGVLMKLLRHARIVEDATPMNPEVTKFKTRSGYCINCDCRVESRAAHQPPAADVPHGQIGINALALGVMLRVRHRLPFRQISQVFLKMAGLSVSAGGLVKQVKRIARWLEGEYQKLILKMRASKVLHADETGWRIDGTNAWTWVFTQPLLTLFVTDRSRGRKVISDILGEAFGGKLVCDFYGAYDGIDCEKQRCLTHLLREVKDLGVKHESFASDTWAMKLKKWCKDAIAHKKKWKTTRDPKYEMGASRIEDRLDGLIKIDPEHVEAKRLRKRLAKYRPELTRFLWDEHLEPTNNPAERALRPMVVARKITGGSRSPAHAQAWAKLSSILATQEQNGKNVLEETKKLLIDYWATGTR
jgi:transposase